MERYVPEIPHVDIPVEIPHVDIPEIGETTPHPQPLSPQAGKSGSADRPAAGEQP